ncbi:CopG family transcriptional regulator [Microseira wollei]|uniref:Helix-turn-helix protein, CopG n=1 Tax=Microseira wollei NIES-4236 TaxID=2530354 RepID=A0AAV3XM18_9CYAN|nr:CopG family transcriptional regulator [Microseira wollei]GET42980.1 helix-turn-helix protein, CopG [Microseira wollei NIES-4236]
MTKKKDGKQFDDLFGAVKGGAEDIPQPTEKKQAKGNNPDYVSTTFYLPKQLHRQLKIAAVDEEREMSDIVAELVERWLKSRNSDV